MQDNKNNLASTLKDILSSISDDYYIDLYLLNYKHPSGVNLSNIRKKGQVSTIAYPLFFNYSIELRGSNDKYK